MFTQFRRAFVFFRREKNPETSYLNEAADLLDLEYRQREIDSGAFRRKIYGRYY